MEKWIVNYTVLVNFSKCSTIARLDPGRFNNMDAISIDAFADHFDPRLVDFDIDNEIVAFFAQADAINLKCVSDLRLETHRLASIFFSRVAMARSNAASTSA